MNVDLSTRYLGLDLSSPLVASAGPLTGRLDTLQRLEDAGAAAVVLPSLFEEEVVDDAHRVHALLSQGTHAFGEAMTYLPEPATTIAGPERQLELVARAKESLSIPVIASLNGVSRGGWLRYAVLLEEAGADAIELNVYTVAADVHDTAATIETRILGLVRAVRGAIHVPLAVKIAPSFSALANFVKQLDDNGAGAVVCFNRFYQPDLDLETLDVVPSLVLSSSDDLRLPLRWIAIMRSRVDCQLALSTGVHTGLDAVKAVLAGADVVMTTSAVLRNGPEHIGVLRAEMAQWLEENEYASVAQARGSLAQHAVPEPDAYERANYLAVIQRGMRRWLA